MGKMGNDFSEQPRFFIADIKLSSGQINETEHSFGMLERFDVAPRLETILTNTGVGREL